MSTEKEDTSTTKDTTDTSTDSKDTASNVTKSNKKRTLKQMQNDSDDDSDDQDLEPPSPKAKKRKLDSESKEEENAEPFKICCFNINGIRAAAKNGLEKYIEKEDADIVCFSEMKAKESQNPCNFRGYELIWCECTAKNGYAGTGILCKTKPLSVTKGIGCDYTNDAEGRAITLEFEKFYLINTYVPNSGQSLKFKDKRLAWDKAMKKYIRDLQKKKPVIWTGDLNVAILDFDVYDGETNKNRKKSPGFTPYERENFRNILSDLDLVDSYRHFYPKEREEHFTFFTKRSRKTDMKKENKGWRLDYFVVSKQLMNIIDAVSIRKDVDCSDHVPLILTMKHPDTALA